MARLRFRNLFYAGQRGKKSKRPARKENPSPSGYLLEVEAPCPARLRLPKKMASTYRYLRLWIKSGSIISNWGKCLHFLAPQLSFFRRRGLVRLGYSGTASADMTR